MGSYRVCVCFERRFKVSEAVPPPDVKNHFGKYAQGGTHMTAEQLHRFLVEVQGEDGGRVSVSDVQKIVEQVLQKRHHITKFARHNLSLDDFHYYLFSSELNHPIGSQVHQDMTAPLSHYFIYTGHNSYLTGNQLSSDCSDVPIIKALNRGVRVVELDIWPNSTKDDVHVLHGRTLTAPVELIKCLKSIKEHAFSASPYPVIITLEDHLPPDLQAKVAQILTDTFGDMLFRPEREILKEFPSPEELKYRVIISTKPPKEYLKADIIRENTMNSQKSRDFGEDDWSKESAKKSQKSKDSDGDECGKESAKKSQKSKDSDEDECGKENSKKSQKSKHIDEDEDRDECGKESAKKSQKSKDSDGDECGKESAKKSQKSKDFDEDECGKENSKKSWKSKHFDEYEDRDDLSDPDSSEHSEHDESNDDSALELRSSAADSYKRLIAIHAGKPKGSLKEALKVEVDKVRRLSLSEQALEKAAESHGSDLVRFTQKNFLRVYPKGTRFNSSNYKPMIGWMHGAQMVAFNMQGYGKYLWMMHGMFRSNGGCGYVKKPDFLLNVGPDNEVFNPTADLPVKKTLKVKAYVGDGWDMDFKQTHFDMYSPPDFYARVGIVGVPADGIMKKTKIIEDNWIPHWEEEFEFPLRVPELALLRVEVGEYDMSEKDDFAGQTCLPVAELKQGIRAVPLYNRKGEKYNSVRLLMRFEFI